MTHKSAVVVGLFVLLAAGLHAGVSAFSSPVPGSKGAVSQRPISTGIVVGEIVYRIDDNTTGKHKADGCRVELYDRFVLVYIDKEKVPTWTDNYILPIQWNKIEHMTLLPE